MYDPVAYENSDNLPEDIELTEHPKLRSYDVLILAVAHDVFKEGGANTILGFGKSDCVIYDIKHILPPDRVSDRL